MRNFFMVENFLALFLMAAYMFFSAKREGAKFKNFFILCAMAFLCMLFQALDFSAPGKAFSVVLRWLYSILDVYLIAFIIKFIVSVPKFKRVQYCLFGLVAFFAVAISVIFRSRDFGPALSTMVYSSIVSYVAYLFFFKLDRLVLNSMLALANEKTSHAVVCFDENEKCFYLNRSARAVFGQEKFAYINVEGYKDKLKRRYSGNIPDFVKFRQSLVIGEEKHKYDTEYKIIRDKKNRQICSYLKLIDITKEVALIEQERFRTEHDALTGIYNRNSFFKYAAEILQKNPQTQFLLIATDLMDFKIVNSVFGENAGNELLKLSARLISAKKSPNKICGRISGDKFAVLVAKEFFDTQEVQKNNNLLQESVKKFNFIIKNYIGIYEVSDHFENVKTMFDKAMLAVREIYGDLEKKVAFYDMPLMEKMLNDRQTVTQFESSLAKGEFTMYLHPQVSAETSRIMGAEALARWIKPGKGVVPPSQFIPLLEKVGLIHKLDQYIWELAAKKLAEWKACDNDMYISINISGKDFYYSDVYKILTGLVEKYGISPQKLNIEITETVLMQNNDNHREILQKLHDYGFTIEMDDFGSGYSSLNTLKNLEMNILKIDMDFLKDWDYSRKNKDIISSIISMSKALGMTVVSEGVETKEQAEFLKESGCDIFQGFYFSKPIPVDDFKELYVNRSARNG